MAPNLLSKTAFVRGDFDSTNSQCMDEKSVRPDLILQNVYSHLIEEGAYFRALCPANHLEEELIQHIIDVVDDFKQNFIDTIKGLFSTLEFSEDTSGTIIQGVANELFCEGITWSRIVAFFVFVGELTLQYLANNYPPSIVDVIYECYSKYVKETLTNWISDHGGWEGVRSLSIKRDVSNQGITAPMPNGSLDKGWANSILYSTVKMFGTIAFLANSSGSNLP